MEIVSIKSLLNQVSSISKKYEEIAEITGENFNIFSILRLETSEVGLHSRLIGELLNPNGSHKMGSVFLEKFCEKLELNEYSIEQLQRAKVIIEEHVGFIDNEYNQGGYIDIIIKPEFGIPIIIENKINAGDQKHQLIRYKKAYPQSHLYYLKPKVIQPSELSTKHQITGYELTLNKDFYLLSYENEILKWVESCLPSTFNKPLLRETLNQYIFLIKKITNQSTNKTMSNEIKELLIKDFENYKSAQLLGNLYHELKGDIFAKFKNELKKREDEASIPDDVFYWKDFKISFWLEEESCGFYYGFQAEKKNSEKIDNRSIELSPLIDAIKSIDSRFKNNHVLLGWLYAKDIDNFYSMPMETIFNLNEEQFLKSYVQEICDEGNVYINKFKEKLVELDEKA